MEIVLRLVTQEIKTGPRTPKYKTPPANICPSRSIVIWGPFGWRSNPYLLPHTRLISSPPNCLQSHPMKDTIADTQTSTSPGFTQCPQELLWKQLLFRHSCLLPRSTLSNQVWRPGGRNSRGPPKPGEKRRGSGTATANLPALSFSTEAQPGIITQTLGPCTYQEGLPVPKAAARPRHDAESRAAKAQVCTNEA